MSTLLASDKSECMRDFLSASRYTDIDLFSGSGDFVASVHRSVLTAFSPLLDAVVGSASLPACHCAFPNCPANALTALLAPTAIVLDGYTTAEIKALIQVIYYGHCHVSDLKGLSDLLEALDVHLNNFTMDISRDDEQEVHVPKRQNVATTKRKRTSEYYDGNESVAKKIDILSKADNLEKHIASNLIDTPDISVSMNNSVPLALAIQREDGRYKLENKVEGANKNFEDLPPSTRVECAPPKPSEGFLKANDLNFKRQTRSRCLSFSNSTSHRVLDQMSVLSQSVNHSAKDPKTPHVNTDASARTPVRKRTRSQSVVDKFTLQQMAGNARCLICMASFSRGHDYKLHLAEKHHYAKISSAFGVNELTADCSICGTSLMPGSQIMHMAIDHNQIEAFMSKFERIELAKVDTPGFFVEEDLPTATMQTFPSHAEGEAAASSMSCCDKPFSRRELPIHLLHKHYSQKVLDRYSMDKTRCILCHEEFQSELGLVSHIGFSHNKIIEFCTKEFAVFIKPNGNREKCVP